MAQRTYRLSISPEDVPEVRRVIDFDGRMTLDDVHAEIVDAYGLDDSEHLYAFFMSGRFWDSKSAYMDPRTDGESAAKALLFRLGLRLEKSFAYLLDFGTEQRFTLTLVAVSDVERALEAPLLVESVGEMPKNHGAPELPPPQEDPPELAALVVLAEAFLDADDELDDFEDELTKARAEALPWEAEEAGNEAGPREPADAKALAAAVPAFRETAAAATTLLAALAADVQKFLRLDEWLLERALGPRLLDLPLSLALVDETETALVLARAMVFIDPELLQGDIAVILARAGRRDEAIAQINANLESARDEALVEAKAGDAYRALGDTPAAEAYYRRSLSVARTSSDRLHALLRLVTCLTDSGRDAEANVLMLQARQERGEADAPPAAASVGRNDPCPCGSGKKYKKCHGAPS
jgi:tetratricopeptide (TPR) repeat protein